MTERPMHRRDRQLPQQEAWDLLTQGTCGILSVVGDEGWPYAVPLNYTVMDGRIYLHCAKAGYKLDAIARDDRVCFTVVAREELVRDHATALYASVVVLGRAALVPDEATRQAALAHLVDTLSDVPPDLRDQYIQRRGKNTAVLCIQPLHITGKAKADFRPIGERIGLPPADNTP